ncbi:unnamed protein product [Prunus armeniaca]|uniref:Uncharacterized protein n=1 Tax=Prunus armeniaca TaxID=36596 RepID=A0A6J5VPR6_PRUAR|nr:unnamed protein product [Prunus armeniaca]CAB4289971.1 unnamed protein product [Prunus armeniaca]CAB4311016.1 unnamed protein product [Prunus armeniaca]
MSAGNIGDSSLALEALFRGNQRLLPSALLQSRAASFTGAYCLFHGHPQQRNGNSNSFMSHLMGSQSKSVDKGTKELENHFVGSS